MWVSVSVSVSVSVWVRLGLDGILFNESNPKTIKRASASLVHACVRVSRTALREYNLADAHHVAKVVGSKA